MHLVVCINRIPDPEAPWYDIRLNDRSTAPVLENVNLMVGPFDENALEVALQFRDSAGGRVTALSLGPATHEDALRRALAVRCDVAVHVKEETTGDLDSAGTARLLAAAIRKLGDVDAVLCGRQVGDWDGGQVGQLLAEELGFSCVSLVREILSGDGRLMRVAQEIPEGVATTEVRLPAVATVTNTATNKLRVARVKDAMAARRASITAWTATDLGIPVSELAAAGRRVAVKRLSWPVVETRVKMIDATDVEVAASALVDYILGLAVVSAGEERTGGIG